MSGGTEADERGLAALRSAAAALEAANLEHWFLGGWAVDVWVGRVTRPHDDIDVLVWRRDEARVHEALSKAGWIHAPTPEDRLGTPYVREGDEFQLTFIEPVAEGGVVVPVPDQPIVLAAGQLHFVRRDLHGGSARVMTLEMMLAGKDAARPDRSTAARIAPTSPRFVRSRLTHRQVLDDGLGRSVHALGSAVAGLKWPLAMRCGPHLPRRCRLARQTGPALMERFAGCAAAHGVDGCEVGPAHRPAWRNR